MPRDPDLRLLRAFTAVAEELHFTRAAARLHVAQQALSRDIRRLERETGAELFVRTTRQVLLTPEGQRLLPYARRVVEAYAELAAGWAAPDRPLLVDVGARASTGYEVLAAARRAAPGTEFAARFHTGLTGAAAEIQAGRLDVSFGRAAGLPERLREGLAGRLVRYEPMAVVLPRAHRLAGLPAVPLPALAGETLYAGAGNPATAEWTALARELFAPYGIRMAAPFPEIAGEEEFERLVGKRGWSVLATCQFKDMPDMVLRPLTEPVPLSPVWMVWRRGLRHPGLDALHAAVSRLVAAADWLCGSDGWLADADERLVAGQRGGIIALDEVGRPT